MNEREFEAGVIRPIDCMKEAFELIKADYWLLFAVSLVGILIGGATMYVLPMICGILLDRPPPAEERAQPRSALNNIVIEGGAIRVRDEVAGVSHIIDALRIGLPQVSNLPSQIEQFVEPSISAQVNGQPFALSGRTRPFADDRETLFEISLDAFDFKPLLAYLPFKPAFVVTNGSISSRLALRFAQPVGVDPLVALSGNVTLDKLEVRDAADAAVLALARLEVDLADVRPLAGVFRLQKVALVERWWISRCSPTGGSAARRCCRGRKSLRSRRKLPPRPIQRTAPHLPPQPPVRRRARPHP